MIGRSAFQYNVIMARHLPAGPNNAHECLDLVRCKRAADLQSFYDDVIALGQLRAKKGRSLCERPSLGRKSDHGSMITR